MLLSLLACSSDFGLTHADRPRAEATEESPANTDTAEVESEPTDTAVEAEPADTAVPGDTANDPAPEDDCTTTDDLVYVLARDDGALYTFDPSSLSFTRLGVVSCRTSSDPASMAISRDGVAYIRYADESVYAVALDTLACTATTYSDRRTSFDSFGMGYATDEAGTWRDHLYVANSDTLGVLDPSTWEIHTLGRMASQSELTGNASGELWAMLPLEVPAELQRLDKTTGEVAERLTLRDFPSASQIDTFAFATWDGSFYLFVSENGSNAGSDVYEVTPSGAMSKVLGRVGFDVVGAGVSTCAPG